MTMISNLAFILDQKVQMMTLLKPAKKAATATTAPVAAPAAGTKASANLGGIKQGGSVKAEGAHD